MPVTVSDGNRNIGVTNYADTVVFDSSRNIIVIRFGGYPETVQAMSDAVFSDCGVRIRLPSENTETVLYSKGIRNYERRIKTFGTCAECVMKVKDDEAGDGGDKALKDIYIFCETDEDLFSELDRKLSVPLLPCWSGYFIRELTERKLLTRLNVYSVSASFSAYKIALKNEEEIAAVLTDGLKSGEIEIPGGTAGDTAFKNISSFTNYLETFGTAVAKRIQDTFKPVFDPTSEEISRQLKELNGHIRSTAGYPLYDAQLAGAEAMKRRLEKERLVILSASCGTGKTKIGTAALYAYQQSKGGGAKVNVVSCPSHIAKKWVRELYETVPGCIARTVSDIKDIDRMYRIYKQSGKTVFLVVSKETARNGYLKKPAVIFNKHKNAFVCPDCGAVQKMTVTSDGISVTEPADSLFYREENAKNHKCRECGTVLWSALNPDSIAPEKNEWVRIGQYGFVHRRFAAEHLYKSKSESVKKQIIRLYENPDGVYPAAGAYRRYPLSRYIKHKFRHIDAYICDELHEYSGESAQGEAMAELAGIADRVVAMTATLINGYAKGMFYLLFRLKPRLMLADGFRYSDARKFCHRYGVVETVYETGNEKYNAASKNRIKKLREKFLPGISPLVYTKFLMENTVFLSLYDMAKELPEYEEIPVACDMSDSIKKEYRRLETQFKTVMRKDRRMANRLLSVYLNLLTAYPDQPYGHEQIAVGDGAIIPKDLSGEPDEKLEKVLALTEKKIKSGERVIIYTAWVRLDTQDKLKTRLDSMGIKSCVLSVSVPAVKREEWVREKLSEGVQVLITNPYLVQTGLDLNDFTTLIFYNLAFNLYVLRQASCRSWRINQTAPKVEVYLFYYSGTMQQRALKLMASKLSAATMIEGQLSDEGLAAMSECEDMTAQLARELMNGIKENVEDLTAAFRNMAVVKTQQREIPAKADAPAHLKVINNAVTAGKSRNGEQLNLFSLLAS